MIMSILFRIREREESIIKMNEHLFLFILCCNDEFYGKECLLYLQNLKVPEGYEVQACLMQNETGMTTAYNKAMSQSDAKYKIYLHQDLFVTDPNLLYKLLKIFEDKTIGMVGAIGGTLNKNGDIHHFWDKGVAYNVTYDTAVFANMGNTDSSDIQFVEAIDGMFMATQYDVKWNEDVPGWHMYDISHSIDMSRAGYRICVPAENTAPMVCHDSLFCSEKGYDEARRKICCLYPEIFTSTEFDRDLIVYDMDSVYQQEIYDQIQLEEMKMCGRLISFEDDSMETFWEKYQSVRFLLRRMEFGLPGNHLERLKCLINSSEISIPFLSVALQRSIYFADKVLDMIENNW